MARRPHKIEQVDPATLKPHPRNYATHPEDQLDHLVASIREHGFYRNVVIARDGTILAGHGAVEAAQRCNLRKIPVVRLNIAPGSARALKVLTGDNEIRHLIEVDDRALTELLREIHETDDGDLLGTGYDDEMLAALAMVTRPASEIEDADAAAEWAGMPQYEPDGGIERSVRLVVHFRSKDDRAKFFAEHSIGENNEPQAVSVWWPARENDDRRSVRLDG